MKFSAVAFMAAFTAVVALGQATFELQSPTCTNVFPAPCGTLGDPEGVSWSGPNAANGGAAYVDNAVLAGFPSNGLQYLRVVAQGPVAVPQGGPFPLPFAAPNGTQVCIPVPPGTLQISFDWDFYDAEGFNGPGTSFNDGVTIDLVDSAGNRVLNLVYADDASATAGAGTDAGNCSTFSSEMAPSGVNTVSASLATPTLSGYTLNVVVWNGGDDAVDSAAVLDNLVFLNVPGCTFAVTSPLGPGSLLVSTQNCTPGATYLTPVTLVPGAFPNGWCFGIDISVLDLVALAAAGPPFLGTLDGTGGYSFGPVGGLPTGLTFQIAHAHFTPGLTATFPARSYTIP